MNIGILGTGSIARTMAAEFAKVPAFRCEAVCSRQQATGEALAQQFGIPKVYTDYDAMLADPDIELVYIATPNSLHYAQTKAAIVAFTKSLAKQLAPKGIRVNAVAPGPYWTALQCDPDRRMHVLNGVHDKMDKHARNRYSECQFITALIRIVNAD